MGAHRRRILRQRGARKRHVKSPDTTSLEGDTDCGEDGSLGSCWEEPASRRLSRGTLIRHHPVPCSSSHGTDNGNRRMVPPYHSGAACAEMIGYARRLSPSHEAALGGLRQWLTRESVNISPLLGDVGLALAVSCPPEEEDLVLLRFLRHNAWDVELTRAQLEASLSWRIETGVASNARREPWEVSGCASKEAFEELCRTHYPHYTIGTDRAGRPILVQKYGNFDTSKLQEFTTLPGLLRYHAWEQENNADLLRRASARTGYLVETYAVIMDFKGMSMGQVNRDFLWLLRKLSEMDRTHYPGRGGVIFVINTPPLFGLAWQGIRGFLTTQATVHIFGVEKEWKAALAEAVDPAVLPLDYGGTAPHLADTPLLPAFHRALGRDTPARVGAAAAAAAKAKAKACHSGMQEREGEAAVPVECEGDVTARSMSALLRRFSLGGDGDSCTLERQSSSSDGSSLGGDQAGGVGPVVFERDVDGGGGGSSESGGVDRADGGDGTNRSAKTWGKRGKVVPKDVPQEVGGSGVTNEDDDGTNKNSTRGGAPSHRPVSGGGAPSNSYDSAVHLGARAAASMLELPASDDPRATASSSSSSPSSSHVIIVRQRHDKRDGSDTADRGRMGKEDDEEDEDRRGGLECVLDYIPSARLAATVAGTVADATLTAALGVAGFTAGVMEAVVPAQAWAEGVHAFQSARFLGGWALGR
ncbi:unnamed protein product [Ectocarpus sp. CCAP 1310/34]|nr:unnamed protein product [Ectocarpus sp. CCAP 1310/34]